MKKATIHVYAAIDELLSSMADYFVKKAAESIANHDEFTVALSGGSSPEKLYRLLSSPKYRTQIDWTKVYFFFGDERYVPTTDARSNALMAKKSLFHPLNIPSSQIFVVDTSLTPEDAAARYDESIRNHFDNRPVHFDLILLGLGDNAHTASLFPYTAILKDQSPSVKSLFVTEIESYRISFTAPLINQARHVAFLVYGEDKSGAVKHVLVDEKDVEQFPAQLIHPNQGDLRWFVDKSAASLLG